MNVKFKGAVTLLGIAAVAGLSGCATGQQAYQNRLDSVMGQARSAETFVVRGTNVTFTITGATEICLSQILNPLASPKTAVETVTAGVVDVAKVAVPVAGAVMLTEAVSDRASNTSVSDYYIEKPFMTSGGSSAQ